MNNSNSKNSGKCSRYLTRVSAIDQDLDPDLEIPCSSYYSEEENESSDDREESQSCDDMEESQSNDVEEENQSNDVKEENASSDEKEEKQSSD